MTDQPTKGPFYNAQWTMIFDYMVRVDRLTDRAEFSGPNREANARKFMHVDELVDACEQARGLASSLQRRATTDTDRKQASIFLDFFDDILAKIKGDNNK